MSLKKKKKKKSNLRAKLIKSNDNGPFKFKGPSCYQTKYMHSAPTFSEFGAKWYPGVAIHLETLNNNHFYEVFFFFSLKRIRCQKKENCHLHPFRIQSILSRRTLLHSSVSTDH